MSTVTVKYKCACMDERTSVEVPERAPAVDVVMWLNDVVMPRVARDHRARNPRCRETTMQETLLPAPKGGHIGGAQEVER